MKHFIKQGSVFIWLTGLAMSVGLLMIGGLLTLILVNGLGIFWPEPLIQFQLKNGEVVLGEIWQKETYQVTPEAPPRERIRVKIANRDFYGLDFRWINRDDIESQQRPLDAFTIERRSWGNFFGFIDKITVRDHVIAEGPNEVRQVLPQYLREAQQLYEQIRDVQKNRIGDLNYEIEKTRRTMRRVELRERDPEKRETRLAELQERLDRLKARYQELEEELVRLEERGQSYLANLRTVDGQTKTLGLMQIVRAYQPNQLSSMSKAKIYISRLWEFLSDEPRESNTEGGVLPAIFGTVLMVILMSIAVVPLGVVAAIYMREYAKPGPILNAVRIAVNNLAGVPSIVFGIFGLGLFIYTIGGTIDRLFFPEALPTPTFGTGGILWASLTLALLTLPVVIVTTEEGLAAIPRSVREASLALGATKFETLWRVILPSASPSIFTGMILAVARAAGEVAPLMVTGVVKLAPSLPIDGHFPYLHLDRKFMHLGFHIYDVGFQSPNVEAALPMVYTTTLLLVLIVLVLNLTAIFMRNRLRERFSISKL
ncbi:MAG: phosphate ABC transporter permease PstA [candidate division KSB1 bacterium]|nr:phosphate ABC transporter permease PstA [candidate division KSB1 bacterium]